MRRFARCSLAAALLMAAASPSAFAQDAPKQPAAQDRAGAAPMHGMPAHDMPGKGMQMHGMPMHDMPMKGMHMTGDQDYDFATMMRMHHAMGVRMATKEVETGKDPDMKRMAQSIIDAQTKEIAQFDAWISSHPRPDAAARDGKATQAK